MPLNVSHEQRVEWGRKGGLIGAANQSPGQRKLSATIGANARAAKYSHAELQQIYSGHLGKNLAGMTPEKAKNFQRDAGSARMRSLSPEERSAFARRAITLRWAKINYAKNPGPADRLLAFLYDFISTKHYSPSVDEIVRALHHDAKTVERLLQMLVALGHIKREAWRRGIVLCDQAAELLPAATTGRTDSETSVPVEVVTPRTTRKCYECDEPSVPGKTKCPRHLLAAKEGNAKRLNDGAYRARQNALRKARRSRLRSSRRAEGKCYDCEELALPGKIRCEKHLAADRARSAKYKGSRP